MAESVYKVIELVGTSPDSWERAASAAIDQAASTLRDLRIAEVTELDEGGAAKITARSPACRSSTTVEADHPPGAGWGVLTPRQIRSRADGPQVHGRRTAVPV